MKNDFRSWKQQDSELLLHWAGARSLDGSDGRQPSGTVCVYVWVDVV
jgi:hypothetical protein